MDVMAPRPAPPEAGQEPLAAAPPDKTDRESKKPPAPKKAEAKPAAPKQPGTGVGLAIFATVVIVLGLAALATYAYLKTAGVY